MNPLEDTLKALMGVDTNNEIFNLWYELTYLRLILGNIVEANKELGIVLTPELIESSRLNAENIVRKRFPYVKLTFTREKQNEEPPKTD